MQTELSTLETESLRKTLKEQGFTFSHLMEAAVALAKLSFTENPEDIEEDETSILDAVLEAMAYDTSP